MSDEKSLKQFIVNTLDDAEYTGGLIELYDSTMSFIKNNTKKDGAKTMINVWSYLTIRKEP